jgi:hypothetical protein
MGDDQHGTRRRSGEQDDVARRVGAQGVWRMPRELQLVHLLERRTWRQHTGDGEGHHAVMVVFVAACTSAAAAPQVNPHAAASTPLKPLGFARTIRIRMLEY